MRVEINTALQGKFGHVQTVPLYDVIFPDVHATSVYGAGTRLKTFRNDAQAQLLSFLNVAKS